MVQESEKLRIVLDANVLFSGVVSRKGCPAQILDLVAKNEVILLLNDYIISEVETHLAEKGSQSNIGWFRSFVSTNAIEKSPIPPINQVMEFEYLVPRDLNDVPIVLSAYNANADFLVSGDKDINSHNETTAEIVNIVKVVTPRVFADLFEKHYSGEE